MTQQEQIDSLTAENKKLRNAVESIDKKTGRMNWEDFAAFENKDKMIADLTAENKALKERIEKLEKTLREMGWYTTQRLEKDELIRLFQKVIPLALGKEQDV
jgi:peptidoglycan hydrolase CwlO-like protein